MNSRCVKSLEKVFVKHVHTHEDGENIEAVSHFASQIHTSYLILSYSVSMHVMSENIKLQCQAN